MAKEGPAKRLFRRMKDMILKPEKDPKQYVNGCWMCDHTYKVFRSKYGKVITPEAVQASCPVCNATKPVKKADAVEAPEYESLPKGVKRPKPRTVGEKKVVVVAGSNPIPLKSAKWSTLKEWAEATRDHFEAEGRKLGVAAILNLVRHSDFGDRERREKAVRRLRSLYKEEWEEDKTVCGAMLDKAARPPIAPESRAIDDRPAVGRFRGRKPIVDSGAFNHDSLSSAERKVLKVLRGSPMTWKEVKKRTKLKKALPPLKRLVKRGLVVKTVKGNYRLKKEKST